jgi:predicted RNA binding protein YcfA (HicA-like mRNA interferase family)
MPKLPRISGNDLLRILTKHFRFKALRQKGSHITLTNDEVFITIPLHPELDTGTLNAILKDAEITRDEFLQFV